MKFINFVATLFFVCSVTAQITHSPNELDDDDDGGIRILLEHLEKRATTLIDAIRKAVADDKQKHDLNPELLNALITQQKRIETLAAELRNSIVEHKSGTRKQLHHVHMIEEQLLFLENRVAEEIDAINHAHDHDTNETAEHMAARAEKLISQANEALTKYPNAKVADDIRSEIVVLRAVMQTILTKPSEAELRKQSQVLARQEKALRQLIDRAAHEHDHHHHASESLFLH